MFIFKENLKTGLMCGVNDFGELFLGDDSTGYNLPDSPENREYILADFDFYNNLDYNNCDLGVIVDDKKRME